MKRSRRLVRFLPDDIVMEVLSRLPADDVLKFRRVCRRWNALISTQSFSKMHLKVYTFPSILVQVFPCLLLLVDKWEPQRKRTRTRKLCLNTIPSEHRISYCFRLSYDGLIVLKSYIYYGRNLTDFIIFNPITGDKVSIICRIPGGEKGDIYGMFFQPQIKEYCIIWGLFERGPHVQFKLLTLGSQPCCRALKPPPSWIYKPRVSGAPVVIDEDATLFWIVGDCYSHANHHFFEHPSCKELIMAFDIKTEQFIVMPHPGPTTKDCYRRHLNMNILKMDGRLSFVHSTCTNLSVMINIWTLEDSATRSWIKSHSISIDHCLRHGNGELRAMAVGGGELLLQFSHKRSRVCSKRFYACNFKLGTIRTFGKTHRYAMDMCAHVPSFVSLKSCKSEIWMEENLEHE